MHPRLLAPVAAFAGLVALVLAAAPILAAGPVVVRGSVDGAPAARVVLRQVPSAYEEALGAVGAVGEPAGAAPAEAISEPEPEPQPAAASGVARDGSFQLAAPEPGLWNLDVEAPGRLTLRRLLRPLVDAVSLPAVGPPADAGLAVRVVGADGRPLPGARVEVESYRGDWSRLLDKGWRPAPRWALSDDAGRLRLPRMAGETLTLLASAPGLPPAKADVEPGAATAEVRFAAGVARSLRVVDAEGEALPGVVVRFAGAPLARSGEAGGATAVLPDRAAATLVLLTAGGGRAGAELTAWKPQTDEAEAAGAPLATLVLPPPRTVAGRVTDAVAETPLAGALVWAWNDEGDAVESDGRGGFALPLPADAEWFAAVAPGYGMETRKTVDLDPARPFELALEPAVLLTGRVVDGDGEPVAGARLRVRRSRGQLTAWSHGEELVGAESGADGRFAVRGLSPERQYDVRAEATGLAPAEAAATPGGEAVVLVLAPGGGVTGRVLDAYGTPLAGARVRFFPLSADGRLTIELVDDERVSDHETASGAGGRFAVAGLPAGLHDLEVLAGGWAPLRKSAVEVPPDGERDLGDLLLEPGVTLEGRVEDPRGRPVEGAEVRIRPYADRFATTGLQVHMRGLAPPRAVSDEDGRFAVDDLAEEEAQTLVVAHDDYLHEELRVLPDDRPVVRLRPASRVFGTVVGSDGRPVAAARIEIRVLVHGETAGGGTTTRSRMAGGVSDTDGEFSISGLDQGELEVRARAAGHAPGELLDLRLDAGEQLGPLRLELARPTTLVGQVTTPQGRPAAGVAVGVRGGGFSVASGDTTDAEGRYLLADLSPGRVGVRAEDPRSGAAAEQTVELSGGERRLDLTLEPRPAIGGRVVDADGNAVAGAMIQVVGREAAAEGSGHHTQRAGADGRFLTVVGEPGLFVVHARAPTGVGRLDVEVGAAPVLDLELVLTQASGEIGGRLLGLSTDEAPAVGVEARPQDTGSVLYGRGTADGGYRVAGVPEGVWTVVARHQPSERSATGEVVVDAGGAALLDLEFPPELAADATLAGRVLAAGSPVGDAWLRLEPVEPARGTRRAETKTAADGGFRFASLVAGRYRLSVSGVAAPAPLAEVEVGGGEPLLLDLPTVAVAGRVVTPTGLPLRLARVRLQPAGEAGGMHGWALTGTDGRFLLPRVLPGVYLLAAAPEHGSRRSPASRPLEVGAEGRADLEIVLE